MKHGKKKVEKYATPIDHESMVRIASVAANNNEELGSLIADVVWKVGHKGMVYSAPDNKSLDVTSEIREGYIINNGPLTPHFIPQGLAELHNPYVMLIEEKVEDHKVLAPVYQAFHNASFVNGRYTRPMLLIVGDVSDHALRLAIRNFTQSHDNRPPMPIYWLSHPKQVVSGLI